MVKRGVSPSVIQYLDDFCCVSASKETAEKDLEIMLDTITEAGFQVQHSKTCGPARALEFLGIMIDTENKVLAISPERMDDIKEELSEWSNRKSCTKRQLLSLIGKLSFSARVIRHGRKFTRRLIDLSKKAKNLHHRLKVGEQARADIAWWQRCISSHNGITWLDDYWDNDAAIHMYTDASDLAAGALYRSSWTIMPFTNEHDWMASKMIAYREMLAVILGIATFAKDMSGHHIAMYTDNQVVYCCLSSGTSKDPDIMALIRALYYYVSVHGIKYKPFYLSTHRNAAADSLSRKDIIRFRSLCPNADVSMTKPATLLLDF